VARSIDDGRQDGSDRVAPATHRREAPAQDRERRWSGALPAIIGAAVDCEKRRKVLRFAQDDR
jgi:hypothetical protein